MENQEDIAKFVEVMGKPFKEYYDECKDITHTKNCRVNNYITGPSTVYFCETCHPDSDYCMCSYCFFNSDHKDHDCYSEQLQLYSCNCGSTDIDNKSYCCSNHGKPNEKDVSKLIPNDYNGVTNKIENLIIQCIHAFVNKNEKEMDITSVTLFNIVKTDLFLLITSQILSKPALDVTKSILVNQYGYKEITYFQYFYELLFLHQLNNYLISFLACFHNNMELITFPHTTLLDLCLSTISLPRSNLLLLDIADSFICSIPYNTENLFFNERIYSFFENVTNIILLYLHDPINEENYLLNIVDITDALYSYSPKSPQKLTFPLQWFNSLINLITISSNIDPVLIKTGEHVQITETLLKNKLKCLPVIDQIANSTFAMIETEQLYSFFPQLHSIVMDKIHSLLSVVPKVKLNGYILDYRIVGVNQPISPLSYLMVFYTKCLLRFKEEGLPISINNDDAFELIQWILLSLRFKQQVEDDRYIRNDDDPYIFRNAYVFFYHYYLLSDLTLIQILVDYIDSTKLLFQWAIIFELFTLNENISSENEIQELTLENINQETPHNFNSFIRSIVEVERRFEIRDKILKTTFAEEFIINLTAAGVTSPTEILSKIPIEIHNFESIYDNVCNKKGVLTENSEKRIDPFFPFLFQNHEDLLHNTLLSTTATKHFSFPYVTPIKGFRTTSFIYDIFHNILTTQQTDYSCIPYFLVFLSDGGVNNIQCDDSILKEIGSIIGKHHNEVIGCEKIINEVGGMLKEGYITSKPTVIETKTKGKTKNKRNAILKKFQNMQKHYVEDKKIEEDIICDDDGCIVCQLKTTSPIGRMVNILKNVALEGIANLTINGCMHKIHQDCYSKIKNSQCPLCGSVFTHFLPSHNEILTMTMEDFHNLYKFDLSDVKVFLTNLISSLDSTIHSIIVADFFKYQITPSDKDIISTFYSIICRIASLNPSLISSFNLPEMFPEYAYVLLCAYNLPVTEYMTKIVENIAYFILSEYLNPDNKYLRVELLMNSYKNRVKPFNNFITYFTQCTSPDTTPKLITLNDLILFIEFNHPIKYGDLLPLYLPLFRLILPPPTIQEVYQFATTHTCCTCEMKPLEYKKCCVCLKCLKLICEKNECYHKHCSECSTDSAIYIELRWGKICVEERGLVVSEHIYFNKYNDPFSIEHLQSSIFYLDKTRFSKFVQTYYRGCVFANGIYEMN
ncbi:E3 ubiquitin-protein ligase [Entamoeba marina]